MAPAASFSYKAFAPEMVTHEARVESFHHASSSATTTTARSRKTSATATWPHVNSTHSQYPSPSHFASLGLFFSPTATQPDRVLSYIDGTEISGFAAGDSLQQRLEVAHAKDPWLMIIRSKDAGKTSETDEQRMTYEDEDMLPNGQSMTQARRRTFADLWPHDGKRGWKPSSQKLAQAGFHFEPTAEDPDNASCIYCGRTLSGWEKTDDAIHEHIRKKPECPFFNCDLVKVIAAKSRSRATASGRSVSGSRNKKGAITQQETTTEGGQGVERNHDRALASGAKESEPQVTSTPRLRKPTVEPTLTSDAEMENSEAEPVIRARRIRVTATAKSASAGTADAPHSRTAPKSRRKAAQKENDSDVHIRSEGEDTRSVASENTVEPEIPKRRGRPPKATKAKVGSKGSAAKTAISFDSDEDEEAAAPPRASRTKAALSSKKSTSNARGGQGKTAESLSAAAILDPESDDQGQHKRKRSARSSNTADETAVAPVKSKTQGATKGEEECQQMDADQTARDPDAVKPTRARNLKSRNFPGSSDMQSARASSDELVVVDLHSASKDVELPRGEGVADDTEPETANGPSIQARQVRTTALSSVSDSSSSASSRRTTKASHRAVKAEVAVSGTTQETEVECEAGTATYEEAVVDVLSVGAVEEEQRDRVLPTNAVPSKSAEEIVPAAKSVGQRAALGHGAPHLADESKVVQEDKSRRIAPSASVAKDERILSPLPSVARAPSGRQARAASATTSKKAATKLAQSAEETRAPKQGLFLEEQENNGSSARLKNTQNTAENTQGTTVLEFPPPSPVKQSAYHVPALAPLSVLTNLDFAAKARIPPRRSTYCFVENGAGKGADGTDGAGSSMTVQSYLELQITLALEEMRQEGEEKVKDLEQRLVQSRQQVENVLRGRV